MFGKLNQRSKMRGETSGVAIETATMLTSVSSNVACAQPTARACNGPSVFASSQVEPTKA